MFHQINNNCKKCPGHAQAKVIALGAESKQGSKQSTKQKSALAAFRDSVSSPLERNELFLQKRGVFFVRDLDDRSTDAELRKIRPLVKHLLFFCLMTVVVSRTPGLAVVNQGNAQFYINGNELSTHPQAMKLA